MARVAAAPHMCMRPHVPIGLSDLPRALHVHNQGTRFLLMATTTETLHPFHLSRKIPARLHSTFISIPSSHLIVLMGLLFQSSYKKGALVRQEI